MEYICLFKISNEQGREIYRITNAKEGSLVCVKNSTLIMQIACEKSDLRLIDIVEHCSKTYCTWADVQEVYFEGDRHDFIRVIYEIVQYWSLYKD